MSYTWRNLDSIVGQAKLMPEETKEQINDKLKCCLADAADVGDKQREIQSALETTKIAINAIQVELNRLTRKFREICIRQINAQPVDEKAKPGPKKKSK